MLFSQLADAQQYEQLSASVQAGLSAAISDNGIEKIDFITNSKAQTWLIEKADKLASQIPDKTERILLLNTLYYEASRAGLDPALVLAIIETESRFHKYAVSSKGARGYMQVMEFWIKQLGKPTDNLFHLRTNLRYGCSIFRYYLNKEKGNISLALSRYHGSKGSYSDQVLTAWEKWQ